MKKYILSIIGLLASLNMWAQEVTVDSTTLDNPAYITVIDEEAKTAVFSFNRTSTSTSSSYNYGYQSVQFNADSVKIPETITKEGTLYKIVSVRNLCFPRGLAKIVILPNNAKDFKPNGTNHSADYPGYVTGIKTIILSKGVEEVNNLWNDNSNSRNLSVKKFEVNDGNASFSADENGVLFDKNKTTLICAPYGNRAEFIRYTIPSTVTAISNYAFYGFTALERITVDEDNLASIGNYSFGNCTNLSEFISENTSLTTIGSYAFYNCARLSTFTFADNIQEINTYAFYNTNFNNAEFTLPKQLTTIGVRAFENAFVNNALPQKLFIPAELQEKLSTNTASTGNYVFGQNVVLPAVYSYIKDPQGINKLFFGNCDYSYYTHYMPSKIYVPQGSLDKYKNAVGWKDLYNYNTNIFEESIDLIANDEKTATPVIEWHASDSTLTITTATEGATIYYTTDGTTPTASSTKYTEAIDAKTNFVLNAISVKGGLLTTSASYTVDWYVVGDIQFAWNDADSTLAITTANNTEGAKIYYTTDGATPTSESTLYTKPISIKRNLTVKAFVEMAGYTLPANNPAEYLVENYRVAEVKSSYYANGSALYVKLKTATDGATIYYTKDGSWPSDENNENRHVYSGEAFTVNDEVNDEGKLYTSTIRIYAVKDGYYSWDNGWGFSVNNNEVMCAKPEAHTALKDDGSRVLTWSTTTENATIYYTKTTNNVQPDTAKINTEYADDEEIVLTGNYYYWAIAKSSDRFPSEVASQKISFYKATTPSVIYKAYYDNEGNLTTKAKIVGTGDSNETLWYRKNREADDMGWNEYKSEVVIAEGDRFEAKAKVTGWDDSDIWDNNWDRFYNWRIRCSQPSYETYPDSKQVSIITTENNGKIYYTTDGSEPTQQSTLYTGTITLDGNCTLKAIVAKNDSVNSEVNTRNVSDWFYVDDNVQFTQVKGEDGQPRMKLETTTEGATIYYWLNGYKDNLVDNNTYDAPFVVEDGVTVYAYAWKDKYNNNYGWRYQTMSYSDYEDRLAQPSIELVDNKFVVTSTDDVEGLTFHYTIDGSTPTGESELLPEEGYEPVKNGTFRVVAVAEGHVVSPVQEYNVNWFRVANVTFLPKYEVAEDGTKTYKLSFKTETPDATIYWAQNGWDYTVTNNTLFTDTISVPADVTIYAAAVRDGYYDSDRLSFYISDDSYIVGTPRIECDADTVVTITSSTDGATIYYTTKADEEPSINSNLYDGPFKAKGNWKIKAIAVKDGMTDSYVSDTYELNRFKLQNVDVKFYVKNGEMMAELSTKEKGATIYYSVGGYYDFNTSDYTINAEYKGSPFKVDNSAYVCAGSMKPEFNRSDMVRRYVNYDSYTCAGVEITPVATDSTLMLTCATDGATIYYTRDGSEPTVEAKNKFGGSKIKLDKNYVIKAIAVKDSMFNSALSENNSITWYRCKNVVFTPVTEGSQIKMQLKSSDNGTIYYGINGYNGEDLTANKVYTEPLLVEPGQTVWAKIVKDGYVDTNWMSETMSYTDFDCATAPEITADGETRTVSISTDVEGGKIYYTIDGTTPIVADSLLYTSPISPTTNCTVKAIVAVDGKANSEVSSTYVSGWFRVANVSFTPSYEVVENENETVTSYKVSLSTSTEGAKIYFGIDNRDYYNPTLNTPYVAGSKIDVQLGQRVYAIAVKDGYDNSSWQDFYINTDNYTVTTPTINTFSDTKQVVITSTEGATIYYTLKGPDDDAESTAKVYPEGGFTLDENCTIKAWASKEGMTTSSQATRTISDWFTLSNIVMDIYVENDTMMCRLSTIDGEDDVRIYYATGSYSDFNTSDYSKNAQYTGPFKVRNENIYIHAGAMKKNFRNSNYRRSNYIYFSDYRCKTPEITARSTDSTVVISCNTEGATIYYTRDGSDPEVNAKNKYKAGTIFKLAKNETFKAFAVKDSMFVSGTATNSITNWFKCTNVEYTQVLENTQPKMKLTSKDGAKIYYRIDGYDSYNLENDSVYTKPITVESGHTVYAIAVKDGYVNSSWNYKSMDYSGYEQCTAPTIQTNSEKREVTISTVHDEGTIYYTLDGSTPTPSDSVYKTPITPDVNCVVRAIVTVDTLVASNISERSVTWYKVENVAYNPIYEKNEDDETVYKLTLTCPTSDNRIYYAINNYDYYNPTSHLPYAEGDTIVVAEDQWVYAVALRDGYNNSDWNSFHVDKSNYTVTTPSYLTDFDKKKVYLSSLDGSTIYYTIDGSTPDTTSVKYDADNGIDIKANWTIKAMAVKNGMYDSEVREFSISSWYRVSDIVYEPVVSNSNFKMKLKTTNGESGTKIYYKVGGYYDFDQNNLSMNDEYTGTEFSVGNGQYVSAIAVKENWDNSSFSRQNFDYSSYTCSTPQIILDNVNDSVTFRCSTDNATIYYTIDGSDPTSSTTRKTTSHNKGVKPTTNCTIKAYAVKSGLMASATTESNIDNWFNVSAIVFSPYVEGNQLKMRLSTENNESDVTIYYKVDSNYDAFDSNNLSYNNVYDNTKPFVVSDGAYVHAMATKAGYNNSSLYRTRYNYSSYTCSLPTITTNSVDTTATIRCSTTGAIIYYTLDGSNPATSTTRVKYTNSAFKLTKNCTITAIATKDDMMNSSASSVTYNNLKVASPEFELDGMTMKITSSTKGAKIYYDFGTNAATVNSNPYKEGGFTLANNRRVRAIAVLEGWNNSDENSYIPENVVQCPKVVLNNYDGHKMELSTVEGATIYYTTDGTVPQKYQTNSYWDDGEGRWIYEYEYTGKEYSGPITITSVGAITTKAFHPFMNDSDVETFNVDAYANENDATMKEAGQLETSMAWANPETIKEFSVKGKINSADIEYIKTNMVNLEKLDLSTAEAQGGIIPDNAFSDLPLIWISLPNALESVGNNIFSGCKELAAVEWNTRLKIPNNAFDSDVNPNLLLYVSVPDAAPDNSPARNVIIGGVAQNIYLSDGENNNFYCPRRFYANNISYTHEYTLETGTGFGWETIALPFNCSRFVHETKGELMPFAAYDKLKEKGAVKPFWLRELTDIGFKDVSEIEAYKPYIISMPNNSTYATRYRLEGKVTFSATELFVDSTDAKSLMKGENTMHANFMNNEDTEAMWLLNIEDVGDNKAGSKFVFDSGRALRPFEAYVTSSVRSRALISLGALGGDENDDATAIDDSILDDSNMVKVYNLSGVLIKQSSKEDALKGLAKGVYIVNGKRMIVK